MTSATASSCVRLDRSGFVRTLTFDTGQKGNIISRDMLIDMGLALDMVAAEDARVLVIHGGSSDFSRGVEPDILAGGQATFMEFLELEFGIWKKIETLACVTIAALRGHVVGNAAEIALACDFRVATQDVRFLYPEMQVGFTGPIERLSRYVGIGKAKEILLQPRSVASEEALALGLVTRVVEPARLDAEIADFASGFSSHPPLAVALTKRAIGLAYGRPDGDSPNDRKATASAYGTDDRVEGIAAMLARRKPDFRGS